MRLKQMLRGCSPANARLLKLSMAVVMAGGCSFLLRLLAAVAVIVSLVAVRAVLRVSVEFR